MDTLAADNPVLVLDTSYPHERVGHMGLDDVEAIAAAWPGHHFIATHLSDEITHSTRPNVIIPADRKNLTSAATVW